MINKIYKRIHNKYSNIFKFFFFLRYLFAIFLIFTSLFFLIPKFFNFENKQETIKAHLLKYYDLEIKDYNNIEYQIFPFPNLSIQNVDLKIKDKPIVLKTHNINIFLEIKKIYNFENFKTKRILLNGSQASLNINKAKDLINYLNKLKYDLVVKNLSIDFKRDNISLIKIKNINFSNYGFKRYNFTGQLLGKKIKAKLINNNKNLKFKILKTGIKADFELDNKNSYLEDNIAGSSKIKLLNNYLKFDFNLNDNEIKINKSNFRNKKISFSLDSQIKFNPYFHFNSEININEIDNNLLASLTLDDVLKNRKIIKKLSSEVNINYKNKSYFANLIESHSSNLNFAYGRIVFSSKSVVAGSEVNCNAETLLTEKYPRLNFTCLINFENKKNFFKKLLIPNTINNDLQKLNIEGSLNLIYKKVNFKSIEINDNYSANKEDIKYFKDAFESILFNDGFFQMFNKSKIKEFILAVI